MDAIVYDKVGKEAEKVREALYGIYPQETITDAAIASFDDGADNMPIKSLVAQIEPVQDLHGYANPWPAGGGKNKLDCSASVTQTKNGMTMTVNKNPDGAVTSIVLNGTTSDNTAFSIGVATLPAGSYIFSNIPGGAIGQTYINYSGIVNAGSSEVTSTISEEKTTTAIVNISSGITLSNLTFYPMIRLATEADATFAPYSNECPISGWTGAEISNAAVNIWDEEWEQGGISATGAIEADNTKIRSKNYIPVKPGMSVYLKTSNAATYLWFYDKNKTFISASYSAANNVVTIPDNCYFIKLRSGNNASPATTYNHDISINYPATDITYHPYTGNQISVTFPTEAGDSGMVYGGTIDPISRKLAVNRLKKVFKGNETLQWTSSYDNGGYIMYSVAALNTVVGNSGICNMLRPVTSNVAHTDWAQHIQNSTAYSRDQIAFRFDASFQAGDNISQTVSNYLTELDRLYRAGTPLEVVFEIKVPSEYQLTDEQVSGILSTLYGTNNVWANTGNIKKLTYRADLGKYIDSHITTAVANALNA